MSEELLRDKRDVCRSAVCVAWSGAGIALVSSFVALGALMGDAGFALWQAVLFSVFGYALPGQLVAAELYAHGAGVAVISVTVFLVNARLFPMTIALLPLLRGGDDAPPSRWEEVGTAHLVAVTSWVCFLGSYAQVAPARRRLYYLVLGGVLWGLAAVATAVGFFVGGMLPKAGLVALLFLNPAYFLCLMLASLRRRSAAVAFVGGAALLPFLHEVSPEWDILIAGAVGGGLSFCFFEGRRR